MLFFKIIIIFLSCLDIQCDTPEFKIDYDILVVAVGSKTNTYNNPDIKKYSHKLKNVAQAQEIRKHIVDSLETAVLPGQTVENMKQMLSFVVVGGGPTGKFLGHFFRRYFATFLTVSHLFEK